MASESIYSGPTLAISDGSQSPELERLETHTASATLVPSELSLAYSDGDDDDADDSGEDGPSSSRASVSTSLFDHVEEHGRTFHRYKQGKYILPNDELEQNRLDLQHHLCKLTLNDKIHLAPINEDSLETVLDIATGTGIWAIEFAKKFPRARIIGTDLSPIQPEYIPSNLSFELEDAEDDWVYTQKFSYIHARHVLYCFSDPLSIFRKAFDTLVPGGWFEIQDVAAPMRGFDDTLEGTSLEKCDNLVHEAMKKRGIDNHASAGYRAMLTEVGFLDVVEVKLEWPIGTWAKSAHHKRLGAWFRENLNMVLEGLCITLFTRVFDMNRDEINEIVKNSLADINNNRIHAYQNFYIVYGRKPSI